MMMHMQRTRMATHPRTTIIDDAHQSRGVSTLLLRGSGLDFG